MHKNTTHPGRHSHEHLGPWAIPAATIIGNHNLDRLRQAAAELAATTPIPKQAW